MSTSNLVLPLETLCQHRITPTQWTILWLLKTGDWDNLKKYLEAFGGFPVKDMRDLLDRGLLLHFEIHPQKVAVGNFMVSPVFDDLLYGEGEFDKAHAVLVDEDVAYEELFNAYPPFIEVQGQKVSARGGDWDELEELYAKIIRGKKELHQEIMNELAYAKEHKVLNMGLERFLKSRQWLTIRALRESGYSDNAYNNSDVI